MWSWPEAPGLDAQSGRVALHLALQGVRSPRASSCCSFSGETKVAMSLLRDSRCWLLGAMPVLGSVV